MDHETCPDARRDTPVELEGSRVPWDPPGGLGAGGKAERVTYSFGSSSDRHSRRAAPKTFNSAINSIRAVIERIIAHLKNWRILHTDYRRPIDSFATTISAAVGLLFYSLA